MAEDLSLEDVWQMIKHSGRSPETSPQRCNVLVIGKTGVGKSTLINAIFHTPLATTGAGYPVTQAIRRYQQAHCPITVYDTPGLELDPQQWARVQWEVAALIEDHQQLPAEEHIHIIWYCLHHEAHKLDPIEVAWLRELALKEVPLILVVTQTLSRKRTPFLQFLEGQNLPVQQITPLLALPKVIDEDYQIAAHGLDHLVASTAALLPEAAQQAFIREQQRNLDLKSQMALKYVSGYVAGSALVGVAPIPFADAPLLITLQTVMIANLSRIFGLGLTKEWIAALFTALGGAGGMTTIGRAIVSNLLKVIPGAGTMVGGAIAGSTAAALTLALGLAYIQALKTYYRRQWAGQTLEPQELADLVVEQYRYFAHTGRRTLRD